MMKPGRSLLCFMAINDYNTGRILKTIDQGKNFGGQQTMQFLISVNAAVTSLPFKVEPCH
jgi:hypothetical protein